MPSRKPVQNIHTHVSGFLIPQNWNIGTRAALDSWPLMRSYGWIRSRKSSSLGKDPLTSGFDGKWLESQLHESRQEIKSFLLDQRKVAGLGNIYVCESLFLARIRPQRRCYTLASEEIERLADAIRKVLQSSIRRRGTSFSDFVDSEGNPGENQNYLMVFQRNGEACIRCGTPIRRILQGNRSSFYCSNCQE